MYNFMEKCKKVMKRSKKQNESTTGQLCLFELPGIRQQEEERRTKPRKKPAAPSKPAALTFIPPATVKAPETPENTLKTEISARQELNRAWKENPEVLHTLSRMARKNPDVFTLVCRFALVPLCLVLLFSCGRSSLSGNSPKEQDPAAPTIEQAVSFLALAEGWHDPRKTGCTGWGHRVCYDAARAVTPAEADSLATSDLKALSARFRNFRGDSLLLALLAYNVGVKAVKTSFLMDSLTFDAYTSFCYIGGKYNSQQYWRRRAEWMLFKTGGLSD